jgi:hypothetical protein
MATPGYHSLHSLLKPKPCHTLLLLPCAPLQVVNKAIAAELIFVATTNFDQVRALGHPHCSPGSTAQEICTISSGVAPRAGLLGLRNRVQGVLGLRS